VKAAADVITSATWGTGIRICSRASSGLGGTQEVQEEGPERVYKKIGRRKKDLHDVSLGERRVRAPSQKTQIAYSCFRVVCGKEEIFEGAWAALSSREGWRKSKVWYSHVETYAVKPTGEAGVKSKRTKGGSQVFSHSEERGLRGRRGQKSTFPAELVINKNVRNNLSRSPEMALLG